MISKEQMFCDFGDFLQSKGLIEEFIDFVAKCDREEYQKLIKKGE